MAFARTGFAVAANPTITIPTHNVGDLIMLGATYQSGSSIPSAGWTFAGASALPGGVGAAVVYKYAQSTSEESGDWGQFQGACLHVGVYHDAVYDSFTTDWYSDAAVSAFYPASAGPATGVYNTNTGFATGIYIPAGRPTTVAATNFISGGIGAYLTASSQVYINTANEPLVISPAQATYWQLSNTVGDPAFASEASFFSWYVKSAQAGFRVYYTTG